MFGRRSDGKQVKGLDGMTRLMPLFMKTRGDATNKFILEFEAKYLDEYIAAKAAEGKNYTYRDLVVTMIVRCFKKFPKLNRFVSAGRFYQRNNIDMFMNVHKSLRTGDEEVAVKTRYTGYETLDEVKAILDAGIQKAVKGNDSDAMAILLNKFPQWLLRLTVGIMRLFDRWGIWSDKFLFEISPFHASFGFTDLKSVNLDFAYHHLYDFGNCGFFAAMGKEKMVPVVDNKTGEVRPEKILHIGISEDERFIDGLYFSRVLKNIKRMSQNLTCLEAPLKEDEINHLKTYKEIKAERKAKKKQAKLDRKEQKKKK